MLRRAKAIAFDAAISSGRTRPSRITGQADGGHIVELVAKFSAGCDRGEASLALEVIGACLAADLALPVPVPYLVEWTPEWASLILDVERRALVTKSSPVAFGSTHAPNGFSAWFVGRAISESLLPTALAVFTFDALINNPDRRDDNPNCLFRGDQIRIFDHELAFMTRGLVPRWEEPWILGSLRHLEAHGRHIFVPGLRGRALDFGSIRARWMGLSDERLSEYRAALPGAWSSVDAVVDDALALIRDVRDHIDDCLVEVRRVLT